MDRKTARDLSEAIEENLQEYAKEMGFSVRVVGGTFNDSSVTFRVEFAPVEGGIVMGKQAMAFKELAYTYGLKSSDLGRSFVSPGSGMRMQIIGLKPRGRKFPILAKGSDGKTYKFSARMVKLVLDSDKG